MTFFKSLIIFIFIISIFLNIISISESAKSRVKLEKNNTYLTGTFLCTPCKKDDIIIELYETGKRTKLYTGDCKKHFFWIYLYSPSTNPDRFKASFTQYCNRTVKEKRNVPAKYVGEFQSDNFYTFGIINLKYSKIRK